MKKNQKLIVYGAGGLLALLLLYRYYQNRSAQAQAAAQQANPQDQPASDFATLAGQEQADVAALQAQIAALTASPASTNGTNGQSSSATIPEKPHPLPGPPPDKLPNRNYGGPSSGGGDPNGPPVYRQTALA